MKCETCLEPAVWIWRPVVLPGLVTYLCDTDAADRDLAELEEL